MWGRKDSGASDTEYDLVALNHYKWVFLFQTTYFHTVACFRQHTPEEISGLLEVGELSPPSHLPKQRVTISPHSLISGLQGGAKLKFQPCFNPWCWVLAIESLPVGMTTWPISGLREVLWALVVRGREAGRSRGSK